MEEEEDAVVVVEPPPSPPSESPSPDFEAVLVVAAGSFVAEVSLLTVLELSSAPSPE